MIVYYISSHGFGHAARACEVIRNLPPAIPLTIRTAVPENFLREQLAPRPWSLAPAQQDCGPLGPDSSIIDLALTLDRLEPILDANDARLDEEIDFLKSQKARVIVSDVVPFALRAAHQARIPSILLGNFTWAGILRPLAEVSGVSPPLRRRAEHAIARMQRDYDLGELLLVPGMDIPINACRRRRDTALISRRATSRRAALCEAMRLDPARPIYLIYLGREGLDGMQLQNLASIPDAQFISFAPLEGTPLVRPIPAGLIKPGDGAASVDAVIAKPGYGTIAECIAAGTPLLYLPREQFAEYPALYRTIQYWRGGLCLDEATFKSCEWKKSLAALQAQRPQMKRLSSDGGAECARLIIEMRRRHA